MKKKRNSQIKKRTAFHKTIIAFSKNSFLLLIFLLLLVLLTRALRSVVTINEVVCHAENDKPCSTQTLDSLNTLQGKSLFFENIDQHLKKTSSIDQITSIKKKLPGTVIVSVETQKPVYKLKIEESIYTVTQKGMCYEQKNDSKQEQQLIMFNLENNFDWIMKTFQKNQSGSEKTPECQIKSNIHSTLYQTTQELSTLDIPLNSLKLKSIHHLQLNTSELPPIVVDPTNIENIAQKITILVEDNIVKTYQPPIQEVDLRFNHVVLKEITSTDTD